MDRKTFSWADDMTSTSYEPTMLSNAEIAHLKGDRQREAITEALEEDIVFGRLLPKERLIEEDLATRFSVRRYVVRHSLEELEWLGLIERVRNRGAVVRLYSNAEVEDINAVRELIESEAAGLITLPLSNDDLATLVEIQECHSAASERSEFRVIFRSNLAFHKALFSHCPNKALIEVVDLFARKSHAYRSVFTNKPQYLRWAVQAHLDMIEAIKDCDRERLVTLCREHLAPAKEYYIETHDFT